MNLRFQVILSRTILLLFAGCCGVWLLRLDHKQKISTSVLDLFPADEQSPEVEIIRDFSNGPQSQVMLFALDSTRSPHISPDAAASVFSDSLSLSTQFSEVILVGAPEFEDKLGSAIFMHRFELLLPTWLGEKQREFKASADTTMSFSSWLADSAARDLDAFLVRPEAIAMHDLIGSDPLLLVAHLIEQTKLAPPPPEEGYSLIWALIHESPFDEVGQKPVFDAIDSAISQVQSQYPGISVRWSGINRFAAASRIRIEAEIKALHLISIVAVLSVCALFVRRLAGILHFLPVIVLSIIGAWTVSTMVFDQLHVMVFVIGSILAGVAIDYGVYIFMEPAMQSGESYLTKLRRLVKPLLASCLTTVAGFSFLLLSDLPLIRQIGFFVSTGLLCALAVAVLYFGQLRNPFLESKIAGHFRIIKSGTMPRLSTKIMVCLLLCLTILSLRTLVWNDDVRELDIPSLELKENELKLRALFGEDSEHSTAYLSYGKDVAEARQNLQKFLHYCETTQPHIAVSSLGTLLPTLVDWNAFPERLSKVATFENEFRISLAEHGFEVSAFEEFFQHWRELGSRPPYSYSKLVLRLDGILSGPLAQLYNTIGPFWFLSVASTGTGLTVPDEMDSVSVNQLQSLNMLFTRYRWSALQLSLIGLGIIIVGVFLLYPFRCGLRIAFIPITACMIVFSIFGLSGQQLNLFNLLGAFLGFCLSHNYAIFSAENSNVGKVPPVAIRLSAASTATAFGVLSFSQIPVIHALGLTVALIVVVALLLVEFEPLLHFRSP